MAKMDKAPWLASSVMFVLNRPAESNVHVMRRQHAIGTGHAGLGHGHTPPTATTPMQATPRISRPPKTLRRIGFGLMLCSGDQSPGDCQDSGSWRLIFVRGVVGVSGT